MAEETTAESTAVKISTEAAEQFVEAYYTALQSSRHTIANYYVNLHTLPDGKVVPNIIYNGNVLEDGPAVQSMFEYDMPYTHYDVQALNCQVLNPTQVQPAPTKPKEIERNMSIVVFVSGNIRLEEPTKGPLKGFSETLILVPSADEVAGGKHKRGHGWIIQTQNFRFVV